MDPLPPSAAATGASWPVRTLVRLAEPLAPWVSLDAAALLAGAERATGLSDWGDEAFREPLAILLASAEREARLNLVGRIALRRAVSTFLRNRLRFVRACREAPDALRVAPRRPIVVAALPRTGSSLLQQLLAAHPDALSIPLWLGLTPLPAPDEAEWRARGWPARRRGALRTEQLVRTFEPAMMTKHPVGPDLPVECAYFMMGTFRALQWWTLWPVYGYAEWFERASSRGAYETFRAHLQLVQRDLRGTHWALKSPGHFLRHEELRAVLPEARIVRLHRDPVEVLASTRSLFATAHGMMSDAVDHRRVAAINEAALAGAADRAAAMPDDPDRVLDVRYDELVARPLEVVRAIHAWAGIRHDDDVEDALRAWLAAHPADAHGAHRYDPGALDADAVRDRFAAYHRRFLAPSVARSVA